MTNIMGRVQFPKVAEQIRQATGIIARTEEVLVIFFQFIMFIFISGLPAAPNRVRHFAIWRAVNGIEHNLLFRPTVGSLLIRLPERVDPGV